MALKVTLVRHAETRLNLERVLQGSLDEPLSASGNFQARKLGFSLKDEKFSQVYSSGLLRALNTAQWICCESRYPPAHVQIDSRLRERCYGISEGAPITTFKETAAKFGYGNGIHYLYTPPAGESYAQLTERVVDFFQFLCTLTDEAAKTPAPTPTSSMAGSESSEVDVDFESLGDDSGSRGTMNGDTGGSHIAAPAESILVVSHGSLITALLRYLHTEPKLDLIGFDERVGLLTPGNTGITRFTISGLNESGKRRIDFSSLNDLRHLQIESLDMDEIDTGSGSCGTMNPIGTGTGTFPLPL